MHKNLSHKCHYISIIVKKTQKKVFAYNEQPSDRFRYQAESTCHLIHTEPVLLTVPQTRSMVRIVSTEKQYE